MVVLLLDRSYCQMVKLLQENLRMKVFFLNFNDSIVSIVNYFHGIE
jgi:hypothetical protein